MKAEQWSTIESGEHDVRLVVCDMDGTLLDDDGAVPETFWPLVDTMNERGIVFAPASGRQYATLAQMFEDHDSVRTFIADNGTRVVQDEEVVSLTPLDRDSAVRVIDGVRAATHRDLGLVAGGAKRAYVERQDDRFVEQASRYNIDLEIVDDLKSVDDHFIKMATFDFRGVDDIVDDVFPGDWDGNQVVISATHWIDIMSDRANKGTAVVDLQKHLGVTRTQTVVFGDFLNDLEMIREAELSFAMENAHEGIIDAARYLAPSNNEHGVVTVLKHMLNL